ncbi:MAG: DUF1569 domain-containing protein [Bacteroidota bacterium]
MNNLYCEADVEDIIKRLEKLTPASKRQWGIMNVAQMLAHTNVSLETAMGLNFPKRKFLGRIFGPLLKSIFLHQKPMTKNSPTDDNYLTDKEVYDFEKEKTRPIQLVRTFYENGPEQCTKHPHSYLGKMTPTEWAILKWKHYDHHLRQFGV